jgi:hypothetical protein
MHPFTRLPDTRKEKAGLEWKILRKIPHIFLYGTLMLCAVFLSIRYGAWDLDEKNSAIAEYAIIGSLLFHWMCVVGISLYCTIIWIMKGPAYVMDPYYLPEQKDGM